MAEKREYNRAIVRELIQEAFSDGELMDLCHDHYFDVYNQFSTGMEKGLKIRLLIEFCYRHEKVDDLLTNIEARNSHKYSLYKEKLEKPSTVVERILSEASEYNEVIEQIIAQPLEEQADQAHIFAKAQDSVHPLTRDLPQVKKWFLEELNSKEQIFVMSAALFDGLEKQELMRLYGHVLTILQPEKSQSDGEATHG